MLRKVEPRNLRAKKVVNRKITKVQCIGCVVWESVCVCIYARKKKRGRQLE